MLAREICERGYRGTDRQVLRLVRELRPRPPGPPGEPLVRFETTAGEQDAGRLDRISAHVGKHVGAFVAVLGCSRAS